MDEQFSFVTKEPAYYSAVQYSLFESRCYLKSADQILPPVTSNPDTKYTARRKQNTFLFLDITYKMGLEKSETLTKNH